MASSSSSLLSPLPSLPQTWKHHLFPSFHGPDVRKAFLGHILKEFRSKAIDVFIDNNIERSKSIGPELEEAIRGSRIAIVLLSKNYASSTWCLDELVEIIKCREEFGQKVMAIFYGVDPTDIKKQTGDFGRVFKETCKGKTKDNIRRWEQALSEVATIAGYHSRNWDNEAEMIEEIANDVSNKLNNSTQSSDFNSLLVGMESRMIKMKTLLRLDSEEVRIIGICGPPGIGKTTIARSLFHQHSKDFQLSVFMDNIKTKYAKPACSDDYSVMKYLQKKFMSKITKQKGFKIPHLGIVQDRLNDKKVLVVLDDVDRLVQVEAMAKETCWFGPWSRIIITTQDQKLLRESGINHVYKVDFPSSDEALQIFCTYAFDQKFPKDGFRDLAREVTYLAGTLPLGLRIMGSYFRGIMFKEEWKKALPRLWTRLNGEIESILKFSYDALCYEDKKLFLHIACFFNNEDVDTVEDCLAKSFLDVTQGVHVLVEKSLISMESGKINMDKLLVQLGREIVRKQSDNEPGKRQFLVDEGDIREVLTDDKVDSSSVIGINLKLSYDNVKDIICTSKTSLERLSNLQFLRIDGHINGPNLFFSPSLNSISEKLRFLRLDKFPMTCFPSNFHPKYLVKLRFLSWEDFPMKCFPSSFHPKYLVKLVMWYSKLEKLWEGIQPLNNLKWMDLSYSERLIELPNLSTATNLKGLRLSYSSNLVKLPFSIGNAINLQELSLDHCPSLIQLPSSIGNANNLKKLILSHCSSLVKLPSSIGNAINLKKLILSHCSSLVKLPSFIGNAITLQELNLSGCSSLVELPSSIGNAINLKNLYLSHCSSLVELPSSIGNAINLKYLSLSHCSSLVELLSSIGNAINLQRLDLSHCSSLVKLHSSIGNAINLQRLDLKYCSSLVELPSSFGNACINLGKLNLSFCSSLVELPSSIGNACIDLQKLDLSGCSSLVELPYSIGNAVNLQKLNLACCYSLVEFPSSMKNLCRLSKLNLDGCSKLEVILTNINLESLEELKLTDCSSLKSDPENSTNTNEDVEPSGTAIQELGPSIERISRLRRLFIRGMRNLVSLPQLPYSITELDAEYCESLERLDCKFHNPDIRLGFSNCFKLNQEARDLIIHTPTNKYAVLPGVEVPECFTFRAYGSCLTVKLNQKPLCTSTKFKACILLANMDRSYAYEGEVYCSITSKQNALTYCKTLKPLLQEYLHIFEVEAEEVTSTELVLSSKAGRRTIALTNGR